jgi:protein-S-isoprenylcysteine O-methyltransferase Ste14
MPRPQAAALLLILLAWIAWAGLWVILSRGVKPAVRHETTTSRLLHIVPLLIGALLLGGSPYFPPFLNAHPLPRAAWMAPTGAALVAAGMAFTIWARLTLGGNWSGTVTLKHSHELIRTGPYALARHPIYTGLLTALAGTALAIDAWRAVAAFVIIALSFLRKMRTEESFMQSEFGATYTTYRATVPALVPRPWRVGGK